MPSLVLGVFHGEVTPGEELDYCEAASSGAKESRTEACFDKCRAFMA
jgi:hypothetical protein